MSSVVFEIGPRRGWERDFAKSGYPCYEIRTRSGNFVRGTLKLLLHSGEARCRFVNSDADKSCSDFVTKPSVRIFSANAVAKKPHILL